MKKMFKRMWEAITEPFISVAVMIDESKRINEDGSWDKYNRRLNERMIRKEAKQNVFAAFRDKTKIHTGDKG